VVDGRANTPLYADMILGMPDTRLSVAANGAARSPCVTLYRDPDLVLSYCSKLCSICCCTFSLYHNLGMGEEQITFYNGGAVVAMAGKNCVAIASDTRFGIRNQTVAFDFPKIWRINDRCFVGLPGLLTDSQTFYEKLKFRVNLYRLREEREISAEVLANVCATALYERRFAPYFVEPVVAGLRADNSPFLCAMDLLGAPLKAEDFVLAGTCAPQLYGMCESLWRPNLTADELFEVISQCLLASVDRDAFSGWGAVVHVLSPTTLVTRHLKARQD